jgi:hypothetical protein
MTHAVRRAVAEDEEAARADGKLRPHLPTVGVRVTETGTLRYDVLFEG